MEKGCFTKIGPVRFLHHYGSGLVHSLLCTGGSAEAVEGDGEDKRRWHAWQAWEG